MKYRIFLISIVLTTIFYSCEKEHNEQFGPDDEVPTWLKTRITHDEFEINSNPQSGLDIAAWIRYKFMDEYFFEYHNLLCSAGFVTYNYEGVDVNYFEDPYKDYITNKCCKQFVWKGSSYIGD